MHKSMITAGLILFCVISTAGQTEPKKPNPILCGLRTVFVEGNNEAATKFREELQGPYVLLWLKEVYKVKKADSTLEVTETQRKCTGIDAQIEGCTDPWVVAQLKDATGKVVWEGSNGGASYRGNTQLLEMTAGTFIVGRLRDEALCKISNPTPDQMRLLKSEEDTKKAAAIEAAHQEAIEKARKPNPAICSLHSVFVAGNNPSANYVRERMDKIIPWLKPVNSVEEADAILDVAETQQERLTEGPPFKVLDTYASGQLKDKTDRIIWSGSTTGIYLVPRIVSSLTSAGYPLLLNLQEDAACQK